MKRFPMPSPVLFLALVALMAVAPAATAQPRVETPGAAPGGAAAADAVPAPGDPGAQQAEVPARISVTAEAGGIRLVGPRYRARLDDEGVLFTGQDGEGFSGTVRYRLLGVEAGEVVLYRRVGPVGPVAEGAGAAYLLVPGVSERYQAPPKAWSSSSSSKSRSPAASTSW